MTENTLRTDGNQCFVCGPENPNGLQVAFRIEDGLCKAEFTPPDEYCGYKGVTHGGILFSLLDDVMANWLYLQGEKAYTAKCELRFRAPAPIGEKILLEGELIKRKGLTAMMAGKAFSSTTGKVLAEATATFRVQPD